MGAKSSVMRSLLPSLRRAVGVAGLAAILPLPVSAEPVLAAVRDIERDLDARVGFYMHDTHSGQTLAYAADDRFPLNSTFKLLACGALLGRAESGEVSLSQKVRLQDIEIVAYSPEIERRALTGHEDVSLGAACEMTLAVSDNSAANIVLSAIGGPDGLTGFLRSIGDQVTRLDRWETELNAAVPGDPRDSTSPRAIAFSVERLLLGDALTPASKAILREWLAGHRVADALFRAALPSSWEIEDRTGAGGYGSRSIVAVLYPPERAPIVVALFVTETEADFDRRNAAAAQIGAAIVAHVTNE